MDEALPRTRDEFRLWAKRQPNNAFKVGNGFMPFHPDCSNVPPEYRDAWNDCWMAAQQAASAAVLQERERCAKMCDPYRTPQMPPDGRQAANAIAAAIRTAPKES